MEGKVTKSELMPFRKLKAVVVVTGYRCNELTHHRHASRSMTKEEWQAYKKKLKAIRDFAKHGKVEKKKKRSADDDFEEKKPPRPKKVKIETKKGPKVAKTLDKTQRIANAMKAFLWWEAPKVPEGAQWLTMEHGGVYFPDKVRWKQK